MKVLSDLEIQRYPDKVETLIAAAKGVVEVVRYRTFTSPEAGLYALNAIGFGLGKAVGQPVELPVVGNAECASYLVNDDNCDEACNEIDQSLSTMQSTGDAKAIPWTLVVQLALFILDKLLKR